MTPNPRGYPRQCSFLEKIALSLRKKEEHWSFNERLRTRAKKPLREQHHVESDAANLLQTLLDEIRKKTT